ncbi:asparaginase [Effusibacillus pohliae]|uniref:asparaginase n=1 Tax=Effusibacillus pohliae TaxID=232270 RepID=UPI000368366E|nr:asparaginase [Effusibacillus pohliae]
MKKVYVLTTGGTIAMSEDEATGTVRPVDGQALARFLPGVAKYADVVMEEVFNLPSPHLTFFHLQQLLNRVQERLAEPEVAGVVVTHGTDTLEETAFYLDLQLPPGKPVVVTGAMRSSNEIGADGPLNLLNSVRTAASEVAVGKGVLVVLNDEIHGARFVTKTHTSNVATFQSPEVGPIGSLDKRSIHFRQMPLQHESYPAKPLQRSVGLLKMALAIDSRLIDHMLADGIDGLVIEALGQGNVPPAVVPGIRRAIEKGVPVVLVSRCFNGRVQDVYGYEGGGKHLRELGAIFSNGLNGQKARIKLMVLLANDLDMESIRSAFERI